MKTRIWVLIVAVAAVLTAACGGPTDAELKSADDATMKTKVEEGLKAKNCGDISVEVKDGTVTLSGSIEQVKLADCIMAAQETKPKNVVNQLQVQK